MPKGGRRNEWRSWPRRATAEVHRKDQTLTFVLECGHRIEMRCRKAGWDVGITLLAREHHPYPPQFSCGHCHHGSPAGATAPFTRRTEFFDRLLAERRRAGVEVGMAEPGTDANETKIKIIDTVTAIRKRPGMYVGALDATGVHHMLYWALDDILDNARAGRGRFVKIVLAVDGSCKIADDGPALPEGNPLDETIETRLERLTSELPPGPERGVANPVQLRTYLPVLRALSERLVVQARVGGCTYEATYERGEAVEPWKKLEYMPEFDRTQMCVVFRPDPEIFTHTEFDVARVRTRLTEMAATFPGLATDLCHGTEDMQEYEHIRMPNGMADMARVLMKDAGEDDPVPREPFRLRVDQGGLSFDVAFQWHTGQEMGDGETSFSWGNTVRTRSGSHVLGVREAVKAAGLDDVPHLACVSVFVPQPRFSSPLKDVLNNPEVRTLLRDHVTVALRRLVEGDKFALGIEDLRDTLARWEREDAKEQAWKKVDLNRDP